MANDGFTSFIDMLKGGLSDAGDYIDKNRDQVAIMLDMLGSNLQTREQGNAFAGIGQALGQSSIAGKAEDQRKKESSGFLKQLMSMISGPKTKGVTSIAGDDNGGLTLKMTSSTINDETTTPSDNRILGAPAAQKSLANTGGGIMEELMRSLSGGV